MADADLAASAARQLSWVWTRTLATNWPHREQILHAAVATRTGRLARHGWTAVPPTLLGGAARSHLPLRSVGNHLRVLLEAGAITLHRSGRIVLYWRPR